MIQPEPRENWILVTSASHMPRAIGVFNRVGWKMIPYPVDHHVESDRFFKLKISFLENLTDLNIAVHEWLGLAAYYLTGKTSRFFPLPPGQRER